MRGINRIISVGLMAFFALGFTSTPAEAAKTKHRRSKTKYMLTYQEYAMLSKSARKNYIKHVFKFLKDAERMSPVNLAQAESVFDQIEVGLGAIAEAGPGNKRSDQKGGKHPEIEYPSECLYAGYIIPTSAKGNAGVKECSPDSFKSTKVYNLGGEIFSPLIKNDVICNPAFFSLGCPTGENLTVKSENGAATTSKCVQKAAPHAGSIADCMVNHKERYQEAARTVAQFCAANEKYAANKKTNEVYSEGACFDLKNFIAELGKIRPELEIDEPGSSRPSVCSGEEFYDDDACENNLDGLAYEAKCVKNDKGCYTFEAKTCSNGTPRYKPGRLPGEHFCQVNVTDSHTKRGSQLKEGYYVVRVVGDEVKIFRGDEPNEEWCEISKGEGGYSYIDKKGSKQNWRARCDDTRLVFSSNNQAENFPALSISLKQNRKFVFKKEKTQNLCEFDFRNKNDKIDYESRDFVPDLKEDEMDHIKMSRLVDNYLDDRGTIDGCPGTNLRSLHDALAVMVNDNRCADVNLDFGVYRTRAVSEKSKEYKEGKTPKKNIHIDDGIEYGKNCMIKMYYTPKGSDVRRFMEMEVPGCGANLTNGVHDWLYNATLTEGRNSSMGLANKVLSYCTGAATSGTATAPGSR